MRIIKNDLWLCPDCTMIAQTGDATSLDYHYSESDAAERLAAIESGLNNLGPHLVADYDSEAGSGYREFSNCGCDCCGTMLAGEYHRFAVLGPDDSQSNYAREAWPHYIACALWSSVEYIDDGNDGEIAQPLEDSYTIDDLDPETARAMQSELEDFIRDAWPLLQYVNVTAEQCGHDFWLTRNGHGAGFWDRGLGAAGDTLTEACKPYGSCDLYSGDDGKLYAM